MRGSVFVSRRQCVRISIHLNQAMVRRATESPEFDQGWAGLRDDEDRLLKVVCLRRRLISVPGACC